MKRFAEQQQLDEFFNIKKIFSGFFNKIKDLFSKLKFGKKFKINLADYILQQVEEGRRKDTALLGYLAEWYTGYELHQILKKEGLTTNGNIKEENYESTIAKKIEAIVMVNGGEEAREESMQRVAKQQTAGSIMAKQIFEDIKFASEDLALHRFTIEMTGESGKAEKIKADLILTVEKMDEQKVESKVVDTINASLKSYSSQSIGVANNTFMSFLSALFYGEKTEISTIIKELGTTDETEKKLVILHNLQRKYKELELKERGEAFDIIIDVFNENYYEEKREKVNRNILRNAGLDGAEDFYAAILPSKGRKKYVSSRQSEEFQELIKRLQGKFITELERVKKKEESAGSINVIFKDPSNEIILIAPIRIGDTGKRSDHQGKFVFTLNVRPFSNFVKNKK